MDNRLKIVLSSLHQNSNVRFQFFRFIIRFPSLQPTFSDNKPTHMLKIYTILKGLYEHQRRCTHQTIKSTNQKSFFCHVTIRLPKKNCVYLNRLFIFFPRTKREVSSDDCLLNFHIILHHS